MSNLRATYRWLSELVALLLDDDVAVLDCKREERPLAQVLLFGGCARLAIGGGESVVRPAATDLAGGGIVFGGPPDAR